MKPNTTVLENRNAPPLDVRAAFVPATLDPEARTVELKYTAGGLVKRYSWMQGIVYWEELSMEKGHVRLERLNNGAPLLNNHDSWTLESQIGVIEKGDESVCTVRFSAREEVAPIFQDVADGIIRNVSVGYIVHEYEEIGFSETDGLPIWRAIDWEPFEVSLVCIPADPQAGVRKRSTDLTSNCKIKNHSVAGATESNQREEETAMKPNSGAAAGGDDKQNPATPAQPANPAETRDAPDTEAATRAGADAEFARQDGIRTAVRKAGLGDDFAQELITGRVTIEDARAKIIDKLEDQQSPVSRTQITVGADLGAEGRREGMQNAIMHRFAPGDNKLSDVGRQFRGMRLLDLARECIGYNESRGLNAREIATLALGGQVFGRAAMHTTSDFPNILANVANISMRQAYGQTKRTFMAFSRKVYIPDFKDKAAVALGNASNLELILEGGEYKSGTFGEGAEKYRLFTYGKKTAISREAIINDNMEAFTRVPALYAAAAARKENQLVYSIFSLNPNMADGNPLFNASPDGNLFVAAMDAAGVGSVRAKMGVVKDPSGNDILNLEPKFMVVPASLEFAARQLQMPISPVQPNQSNPYANNYEIIVEGSLADGAYYNVADPNVIDTIEYAYLEGEDGPYIETRNGFDVDGVEIKVRHDFAAKAIERRGMSKATLV